MERENETKSSPFPAMEKNSILIAKPHQRLEGKVVIITGGASGLGASTVELFHRNGAKVVIADIQDKQGQALANKLSHNVTYVRCDVSNEEQVSRLIDQTVLKYGKLDIMYNNAGIIDRQFTSFITSKKSDLDKLISVNLVGSFLGAKHAARVMIPQQNGCILFTSSACTAIGGLATQTYALTKYGIVGLSNSLASELHQHGIRVNCISPYGLVTPITGRDTPETLKRLAEFALSSVGNLKGQTLRPEDVAKAALYLASDEANHVSGLNLVVDGGFSVVNPSLDKVFGPWARTIYLIERLATFYAPPVIAIFALSFLVILLSMVMFL